ncbi:MAG TPA: acyl carrier protein [Ignavibacteriales bacterium]|nr:acyl carrier protein [Ignavibacteriales bacterium]
MNDAEIIDNLKKCIAETVGIKVETITSLDASVIDDLGADSLDLLDLVFRIEKAFNITISRGEIEAQARETLPAEEFEKDGFLTDKAKEALRQALPEVEEHRFDGSLRKNDIPRLLTVKTFYRIIKSKMEAVNAS